MSDLPKVDYTYPRRAMKLPQSIEEVRAIVMQSLQEVCGELNPQDSGKHSRLVRSAFYVWYPDEESVCNQRQTAQELSSLYSFMNLKYFKCGSYRGIVNRVSEKQIPVAYTGPSNFEEMLKYFGHLLPKNVQGLFLSPSDWSCDAPVEPAYKCPDCNLWIKGEPFRQYNTADMLEEDKNYPVMKAYWYSILCANCGSILDEEDQMAEIF